MGEGGEGSPRPGCALDDGEGGRLGVGRALGMARERLQRSSSPTHPRITRAPALCSGRDGDARGRVRAARGAAGVDHGVHTFVAPLRDPRRTPSRPCVVR